MNLSSEQKQRIKSGDIKYLKGILEKEYEEAKENLISFPLDKVEELRGSAKTLSAIIKLLP
jgi:hypothetical protein